MFSQAEIPGQGDQNTGYAVSDNDQRFANLERRVLAAESAMGRLRRRLYGTWAIACVGVVAACVLGSSPEARAQFGVTLASLDARLKVVENKTQFVSVTGTDMLITGANVHIRNGLGATNGNLADPLSPSGTTNGLGNLILGYNEVSSSYGDERGGSHNLVIGVAHDYTSFGGAVAGEFNQIRAPYATISGGFGNTASGRASSVSGGGGNVASGFVSSASGGYVNTASSNYSSVIGGYGNVASGFYSSVSAGYINTASGDYSSVSGGYFNTANNFYSAVSGGYINIASGFYSSVSGGEINIASGDSSSVSGGSGRTASGTDDWRAGGLFQDF